MSTTDESKRCNRHTEVSMIAAVGPNCELGSHGDLIWHISEDLKNFKKLTTGHPVIMGRKTWDSLPKRPLPGRLNVVISRNHDTFPGAVAASSVEEALKKCEGLDSPFIIGGEQIYQLMMPCATRLMLTYVDQQTDKKVDAWFPEYRQDWKLAEHSEWNEDSSGVKFRFELWLRK